MGKYFLLLVFISCSIPSSGQENLSTFSDRLYLNASLGVSVLSSTSGNRVHDFKLEKYVPVVSRASISFFPFRNNGLGIYASTARVGYLYEIPISSILENNQNYLLYGDRFRFRNIKTNRMLGIAYKMNHRKLAIIPFAIAGVIRAKASMDEIRLKEINSNNIRLISATVESTDDSIDLSFGVDINYHVTKHFGFYASIWTDSFNPTLTTRLNFMDTTSDFQRLETQQFSYKNLHFTLGIFGSLFRIKS